MIKSSSEGGFRFDSLRAIPQSCSVSFFTSFSVLSQSHFKSESGWLTFKYIPQSGSIWTMSHFFMPFNQRVILSSFCSFSVWEVPNWHTLEPTCKVH